MKLSCKCALAAVCLGLLVSACRPSGDTLGPAQPRTDQTLVISNGAEPKSIDPGLADESSGIEVVNNAFEGLTTFAPVTLAPEPAMAERWEVSDDGLTYVFHLRDARWTDGTPVTAHDFVYAWRRALDPQLGSSYSYQLWYLKNGQAFNEGKVKDAEAVGVKARDARTLEVTLERPTPFFLHLTSFATYMPVPRWAVEKWGRLWTQPQHIVTNGPWKLVRWSFQNELVFERNDDYWNAANIPLKKVVALLVENDHAVLNLYRTAEVDTTSPNSTLPLSAVPSLRAFKDYRQVPYLGTNWLWFNTRKPPFNDVRVRRAFAMALDKRLITSTVLKGLQVPTWSLVPDLFDQVTGYRPPVGENDRYDEAEAQRWLAEAGYPGGKGFPHVELFFNNGDNHRLMAEAAQAMWRKTLGVSVAVLNMEWKVMLSELNQGNFDMARSGWAADYPEPSTFLTVFLGSGGQNDSGWQNAEYDALIERALSEPDQAERNALYAKAERILLDELPVIPMYQSSKVALIREGLEGMDPNPMDTHLWKNLRWK